MTLEQIIEEYLERLKNGEAPSLEDYVDQYPEFAEELNENLPVLALIREFGPQIEADDSRAIPPEPVEQIGDYRIIAELGRGGMGIVYEAEQQSLGRRVALKVLAHHAVADDAARQRFHREARSAASLHHPNIVPVIDVGNDTRHVFLAMQLIGGQSLDRVIADIKSMRQANAKASTNEFVRSVEERPTCDDSIANSLWSGRFRTHSNGTEQISVVYSEQSSKYESTPSSSAVLPGQSATSAIDLTFKQYCISVARIGAQVAEAIQYAHDRGIIHRDVKPSNLMLDANGTVWVTDFGLAKTEDEALTQPGEILGTLRYMAPEQFGETADHRIDIYSLGLTLYELLALRPAYTIVDRLKLIEAIKDHSPPALRSIESRIPPDLETIVLKAIDRVPTRRYESAADLASDLHRFLEGQPILARRIGATERVYRWSKRNPAIALMSMVLVVSLIFGSALLIKQWKHAEAGWSTANQSNIKLTTALEAADLAKQETDHALYASLIAGSWGNYQSGNFAAAARMLDRISHHPELAAIRGWEWHYLRKLLRSEKQLLKPFRASIPRFVAAESKHGFVVSGHQWLGRKADNSVASVLIRDIDRGEIRQELEIPSKRINDLKLSSRGDLFISSQDGNIRIWKPRNDQRGFNLEPDRVVESHSNSQLAVSRDGLSLGYIARDGQLTIAEVETMTKEFSLAAFPKVDFFDINFEHKKIAIVFQVNKVRHFAIATFSGRILYDIELTRDVRKVEFSKTGDLTLLVNREGVYIYEISSAEQLESLKLTGPATSAKFSPSGHLVAAGNDSGMITLIDTETKTAKRYLRGHGFSVTDLEFSSDETLLYSASVDGTVRVWDLNDHSDQNRIHIQNGVSDLNVDKSNQILVSVSPQGWQLTDAYSGDVIRERMIDWGRPPYWPRNDFAISPNGNLIAGANRNGKSIDIHNLSDENAVKKLNVPKGQATSLQWSPDSSQLAVGALRSNKISLIHLVGGNSDQFEKTIKIAGKLRAMAFNADRSLIAVSRYNNSSVQILSSATGMVLHSFEKLENCSNIVFHPQIPNQLAIADHDRNRVVLIRIGTGSPELAFLPAPDGVEHVAYNPDGTRLAAIGYHGAVRLWETRFSNVLLTLQTNGPAIGTRGWTPRVAFSPDGSILTANHLSKTINVWVGAKE